MAGPLKKLKIEDPFALPASSQSSSFFQYVSMSDGEAVLRVACAALQAAGGGVIAIGPGSMEVFTLGAAGYTSLGNFTNCNGVRILGYGTTLHVTPTFAAAFNAFFYFTDCNDIVVTGITASGSLTSGNVAAGVLRGPEFCRFVSGNTNISMPQNKVVGLVSAAIFGNSNSALAHNKGIQIGNLEVDQCIYGVAAQFCAEDMEIVNLRTDSVYRSYFIYGTSRTMAHVYSKNAKGPQDVKLWSNSGLGNTDAEVWYASDASSTSRPNDQSMIEVLWNHDAGDATVVTQKNVKLHLSVEFPGNGTANTGMNVVMFRKMQTGASAFDTTDRGHILDGLTIDGSIKGYPQFNGFGLIDFDNNCQWGSTLDSFYSINIEKLHVDSLFYCQFSLAPLKGLMRLSNVQSLAAMRLVQSNYISALDETFPAAGRISIENCAFTNLRTNATDGSKAVQPIVIGSSVAIPIGWSGQIISSGGALGAIMPTLPSASAGNLALGLGPYTFVNASSAGTFRVDPAGAETIIGGGTGKYLELAFGASVTIIPVSVGFWQIIGSYGATNFEP